MSSHRKAPEISQDSVADNADVYGFISPDKPDTVTLIANHILEEPAGGPNFFEFGNQHRSDHLAGRSELEQAPVLFGDQGEPERAQTGAGRGTDLSALQHWPFLHA